jgi:hypothetical protein
MRSQNRALLLLSPRARCFPQQSAGNPIDFLEPPVQRCQCFVLLI